MRPTPRFVSAMKWTGIALLVSGTLTGYALRFVPSHELGDAPLLLWSLLMLAILTGSFLYWRARQFAAQITAHGIISDSQPDILYLRTFHSDPSTLGRVFSAFLNEGVFLSGLATEEEQLSEVLRPFGDLVAIGRPGERLPPPGAARLYVPDDVWKTTVVQQMRAARLVVIRAGLGEGLSWELKETSAILAPQNLLVLVLSMKRKHFESFRRQSSSVLPEPLPEVRVKPWQRVSGFIQFSTDWKPSFLPLRTPFFRRSVFRPLARSFKFALEPVFDRHGFPWRPPPVSLFAVFAACVMALFGLLIVGAAVSVVRESRSPSFRPFVAPLPAESPWKTWRLIDISLEAPFGQPSGRNAVEDLPKEVQDLVVYQEVFDSGDATDPRITVSRIRYTPDTQVSLDGAVNGGVNGAAAAIGDTDPQFVSTNLLVNSLPARRVRYTARTREGEVHLESAIIQSGQRLWQAQVVYFRDSSAAKAQRILDSIQIDPTE